MDGTGYPKGLRGEDIPFEARVMAVADVYEALISPRCYKSAYSVEEAIEIMKEGRKFGTFLTISSQRPSDISATIISQLHNYFIHRLVNNEDIRAIGKAVAFIDNTSYEMISVLPQGACIFTGVASNFPVLVQVDLLPKQKQPQSNTINLTNLWSNP